MYLDRNGYKIYYETEGTGYPTILLHGLGGNVDHIKALNLNIENIQIITLDMQGHGKSGISKDCSFESIAQDVMELTKHLKITTFNIGGISMGALIATYIAIRYPRLVNKLILLRSAWCLDYIEQKHINSYSILTDALKNRNIDYYKNSNEFKVFLNESPGLALSSLGVFLDEASLKYPEKYKYFIKQKAPYNKKDLESINSETLILCCDNDSLHTIDISKRLSSFIKKSHLYQITSPYIDRNKYNKEVNDLLKDFLS